MKKRLVSLAALVSLIGLFCLTSCNKEQINGNGSQFTATMEPCTSLKTALDGTAINWVAGDQIAIYGTDGRGIYSATPQNPATTAIFDNVSGETGAAPYRAYYPTSLTTDGINITLPATQNYMENSINGFPMYAESSNNQLAFKNLCGAIKLNLTKTGVNISSITITAANEINGTFSIDNTGDAPSLTYSANGTNAITLTCATTQSITDGKDFYIYLPEGSYSGLQIELATDDGRYCVKTANTSINISRSQYTLITFSESTLIFVEPLPEGTLSGLFTINSDGDQIRFSQGNLQYNSTTTTWRFAEHQYDFGISGWTDLFVFGTDYGNNAISNGGNTANSSWRMLSQSEWSYIIDTRSTSTLNSTANARCAKGHVNGIFGLILFPDNYTHPDGVTVPTGINDAGSTGSNGNNYTLSQWNAMEDAGAVFLPAAGNSAWGTSYTGGVGHYWSTTGAGSWGGEPLSYNLFFDNPNYLTSVWYDYTYIWESVRLVMDKD